MNNEDVLYIQFQKHISEHFEQKQYDLVLKDFRALFLMRGFETDFKYFVIARASYAFLENNIEYKNYWSTLSNSRMLQAFYIANNLITLAKSCEDLISDFTVLVGELFDDINVKNNFIDSFKTLAEAYLASKKGLHIVPNKIVSHDKFLVVSGYGWSGSGAVLDYFREFDNVVPVLGEVGILEEYFGFKYFVKNIQDKKKICEHAINFFFINLVGCYSIERLPFYKAIRSANLVLSKSKNLTEYSLQVKSISSLLADIIIESKLEDYSIENIKQLLKRLSKKLLDLITLDVPSNKIPVLDNSIHVQNVDLLNYINDVKVICSFRDPRAIYIERAWEIKDPHDFIKEQSNLRQRIVDTFKCLDNSLQNVLFTLNFEDFVLNKEYRENLANKVGLNLDNWIDQEKYFKPEVSLKNVRNFINCTDKGVDPKAIDLIEKELQQYCYK